MEQNVVLEMRGINKNFPGVKALQDVDFTLRKGEIHALMGENGAGKSTLIKVLTAWRSLRPVQSEWKVHPIPSSTGRPRKHRKMASARFTRR